MRIVWLVAFFLLALTACGKGSESSGDSGPQGKAQPTTSAPTDAEVLAELKARIQGATSIELSDGRGEMSWRPADNGFNYDRGYIIKRPAAIDGFPDAELEVGGLSRWMYTAPNWRHDRDLVTWNTYTGIDPPDKDEVLALLRGATLNYMPLEIEGTPEVLRLADPVNYEWHNATSVSLNYVINGQKIDRQTQQTAATELALRTRIYRDSPSSPWRDPLIPSLAD